jgi:hypothetical protein
MPITRVLGIRSAARPQILPRLKLIATRTGSRTLVAGNMRNCWKRWKERLTETRSRSRYIIRVIDKIYIFLRSTSWFGSLSFEHCTPVESVDQPSTTLTTKSNSRFTMKLSSIIALLSASLALASPATVCSGKSRTSNGANVDI